LANDEVQASFKRVQKMLPCTDCGLDPLGSRTEGAHGEVEVAGGGTIVWDPRAPVRELHVIPHGGVDLPTELLMDVGERDFDELAQLVHDNADTGTRALYSLLAKSVLTGRSPGAAVAAFDISRVLIDANRLLAGDRIPVLPYVGSPELYAAYLDRRRPDLDRLADEWIAKVNSILSASSGLAVYHHHTYDIFARSSRPYDQSADVKRPAFQLFRRRPTVDGENCDDIGLAPIRLLNDIAARISTFLSDSTGSSDTTGQVDFPLSLPVTPFHGCLNDGVSGQNHHIIYEIRKDLLDSESRVENWFNARPWAVPLNESPADHGRIGASGSPITPIRP
jgi:hypothetical protein